MQVLNLNLMKHPMNYLVIFMMLVILGVAGHFVLSLIGKRAATKETGEDS